MDDKHNYVDDMDYNMLMDLDYNYVPNTQHVSHLQPVIHTACIQPVGMKNVFPDSSSIRQQCSTRSPKNIFDCSPDNVHFSYERIFVSVGGISQKIFRPRSI
ncbi:hypothetical protein DERF_012858 [Dermatophagoides farinae]|uniref:Uncharacterized protein n=1 Tax=Dermatophagoides farinae TaxID=6954 RepID=A0A922HQY4_DERFA|nr:hypothetical protein DERF_012858 [Dermatophagoides farinae]